jgi:flagellar biosynthetic protein FliQ
MLYDLIKEGGLVIFICSIIPLAFTAIIGLIVGLIQTATQIQEQSFIFLIKMLAISTLGYLSSTYFVNYLKSFLVNCFLIVEKIGQIS